MEPPDEAKLDTPGTGDSPSIEPAFTRALADYTKAVRRYEDAWSSADARYALADAIARLVDVIDAVPQVRTDPELWEVVQQLPHARGEPASFASPAEARAASSAAIADASAALSALAERHYGASTSVQARAVDLARTTEALTAPPSDAASLRRNDVAVLDALREAGRLLTAMYTALARGEVPAG